VKERGRERERERGRDSERECERDREIYISLPLFLILFSRSLSRDRTSLPLPTFQPYLPLSGGFSRGVCPRNLSPLLACCGRRRRKVYSKQGDE
jgi:hypothetical protein